MACDLWTTRERLNIICLELIRQTERRENLISRLLLYLTQRCLREEIKRD